MDLFSKADINKINCLIDLHLHLDGALSINNIKELAHLSNVDLNMSDEEIKTRIQVSNNCRDLNEFLSKFDFPLSFLQTKECITLAISNLIKEQSEQGLIYCEIRFAPQLHLSKGLTMDDVVKAAIEGCKNASIPVSLILCCMIGASSELNIETVEIAKRYLHNCVEGIDIAGAEGLFKLEDHAYIFELARNYNIPFTIHAGEAKDYQNVDLAIKYGAKRIGHGVKAINNVKTIENLIDHGVTLEMCPTSNLQTKCIQDISQFPLIDFFSKGVFVTVNQDDPAISGIILKHEWQLLIDTFDITYLEVKQILLNSVNASFLPLNKKVELANHIKLYFDRKDV